MRTKPKPTNKLRRLNHFLSGVVIIFSVYLIAMPFFPQVWWQVDQAMHKPNLAIVQVTKAQTPDKPISPGAWLDIPRINLHEQIYTGLSISELNKGAWHIPGTSTPDKGSNTVLAGHRFMYYFKPSGVFYYLDKIQINDRITVDWQGAEYTYKVINITTVPPTAVYIQAPSAGSKLTLYTCTPLWTSKDRLVIQSELVAKRGS